MVGNQEPLLRGRPRFNAVQKPECLGSSSSPLPISPSDCPIITPHLYQCDGFANRYRVPLLGPSKPGLNFGV